ncbi:MAG: phenylpropionate dioxygenase [Comamonas sp. SCN 65-56]|uniref:aromatic-ring-hydroxylating dioxygenase subunit beta n=1 Tax=Comamonas sp. SCN 65-56 TaxID=1660095 RepID=UPI00086E53F5|nr:aromatic-ring-hydroxylating dioxygenase subunit beta [Comamonas sp. SCN 65-56]ODS93445.1 MAG: phenylpropionate dioxygenase [Comamonas sp. SCN 65-56]
MSQITDSQLIDFVYREADLIDTQQLHEWEALFADDGYYWMPLTHGQTDPILQGSLMYEDKLLLKIRIERFFGKRTFSQQPHTRCHHLLQAPRVVARDDAAGRYTLRTAFHFVETRVDDQLLLAAWATHELVVVDGQLRIRLKRVDLLNCDAALPNIQCFM